MSAKNQTLFLRPIRVWWVSHHMLQTHTSNPESRLVYPQDSLGHLCKLTLSNPGTRDRKDIRPRNGPERKLFFLVFDALELGNFRFVPSSPLAPRLPHLPAVKHLGDHHQLQGLNRVPRHRIRHHLPHPRDHLRLRIHYQILHHLR